MTDYNKQTVFYDASCAWCRSLARWGAQLFPATTFVPLQSPGAAEILDVAPARLLEEMRLRCADGSVLGGAAALVHLVAELPGGGLLGRFYRAAPSWVDAVYRQIARARPCMRAGCATRPDHRGGWVPGIVFLAAALIAGAYVERWVFMVLLTLAVFAGAKWLTFRRQKLPHAPPRRKIGYLFGWIGMDAGTFLDGALRPARPGAGEWFLALAKTLFGAFLVWGAARHVAPELLSAWTGLVGLIFLLHFGSFHLLALAWQRAGVAATPIMRMPVAAASLSAFWSRRWNRGFTDLAHSTVFRPVERRAGATVATLAVFAVSGLLHELVISVPAGGGYGLPLVYFLAQGGGVLFERSCPGRTLGLRRGVRGWLFTALFTAGPVFWLFHPPFIHNVALPLLRALHAL